MIYGDIRGDHDMANISKGGCQLKRGLFSFAAVYLQIGTS